MWWQRRDWLHAFGTTLGGPSVTILDLERSSRCLQVLSQTGNCESREEFTSQCLPPKCRRIVRCSPSISAVKKAYLAVESFGTHVVRHSDIDLPFASSTCSRHQPQRRRGQTMEEGSKRMSRQGREVEYRYARLLQPSVHVVVVMLLRRASRVRVASLVMVGCVKTPDKGCRDPRERRAARWQAGRGYRLHGVCSTFCKDVLSSSLSFLPVFGLGVSVRESTPASSQTLATSFDYRV